MTFDLDDNSVKNLLYFRTASQTELEIEFSEYSQYMAIFGHGPLDLRNAQVWFQTTRVHRVTPFQLALLRNRYDIVEKILGGIEDIQDIVAMQDFMRFGNKEAFPLLKDAIFFVYHLEYAAENPNPEMFEFVARRVNVTHVGGQMDTLFRKVFLSNHIQPLKWLLDTFGDFTSFVYIGECVFSKCTEETINLMLKYRFGQEYFRQRGFGSASHIVYFASMNQDAKVLEQFTEAGFSLEKDAYFGAARNHNAEVMRALLRRKVPGFDSRDVSGNTPLSIAAKSGTIEVVKILVEAGANVEYYQGNRTLLLLATENPDHEVMRYLIDSDALVISPKQLLQRAAEKGHTRMFFMLLENICSFPDVREEDTVFFRDEMDEDEQYSYDFEMLLMSAAKGSSVKIFRAVYSLPKDEKSRLWADGILKDAHGSHLVSYENIVEMFARGILPSRVAKLPHIPENWYKNCLILVSLGYDGKDFLANDMLGSSEGRIGALIDFRSFIDLDDDHESVDWNRNEKNWAYNQVSRQQLVLLKARALHVCTILYECSALEQCTILSFAFWPMPCLIPFHKIWNIVTCVKHFKQ